jgi:hypothetical protein
MHSHQHAAAKAASGGAPSHDPHILQPLALPMARAVAWSGLSRSTIYRMAAQGRVRLLKCGRSTLVDAASLRAVVAALPPAAVRSGAKAEAT